MTSKILARNMLEIKTTSYHSAIATKLLRNMQVSESMGKSESMVSCLISGEGRKLLKCRFGTREKEVSVGSR